MIKFETEGRRVYVQGDTFALKQQIKDAGGHWDADRRAWWVGSGPKAEALQAAVSAAAANSPSAADRKPEGEATVVAGRVLYQGRPAYLKGAVERGRTRWDDSVRAIESRDGGKVLLVAMDGSREWWADRSQVQTQKHYTKPQTIASLRRFATEAKQAQSEGRDLGWRSNGCSECRRLQDWCQQCAFDEFDN